VTRNVDVTNQAQIFFLTGRKCITLCITLLTPRRGGEEESAELAPTKIFPSIPT